MFTLFSAIGPVAFGAAASAASATGNLSVLNKQTNQNESATGTTTLDVGVDNEPANYPQYQLSNRVADDDELIQYKLLASDSLVSLWHPTPALWFSLF